MPRLMTSIPPAGASGAQLRNLRTFLSEFRGRCGGALLLCWEHDGPSSVSSPDSSASGPRMVRPQRSADALRRPFTNAGDQHRLALHLSASRDGRQQALPAPTRSSPVRGAAPLGRRRPAQRQRPDRIPAHRPSAPRGTLTSPENQTPSPTQPSPKTPVVPPTAEDLPPQPALPVAGPHRTPSHVRHRGCF